MVARPLVRHPDTDPSTARSSTLRDQAGVTLVELIVYCGLLVLVVTAVGGVLINGLTSRDRVDAITQATTTGQLAARSIETQVRNSSGFVVKTATSAGQLVQARVGTRTSSGVRWACRAWFYSTQVDPTTGVGPAIFTRSSTAGAVAAPSTRTSSGSLDFAGWTLLADGVSLPNGTSAPFAGTARQLTLDFAVASTDSSTVRIASTAALRTQSDTTTEPRTCY